MDAYASTFVRLSPFSIKDLMLGELLCQAGILQDGQLLKVTETAKEKGRSLGAELCHMGILSPQELFSARRLLNEYLTRSDEPNAVVAAIRALLAGKERLTA